MVFFCLSKYIQVEPGELAEVSRELRHAKEQAEGLVQRLGAQLRGLDFQEMQFQIGYLWATQPEKQLAQWEARAYMMQHPLETLKAMGQAIYDEFDKRVIHGSEESRAEFAGEAVFNIASMFVGAGEVSLLAKASQGEKLAAQAARVEAKAETAATRAVERYKKC